MEVQLRDSMPLYLSTTPTLSTVPSSVISQSFDIETPPRKRLDSNTVTIEHKAASAGNHGMFGLSKPVVAVVTSILMATTTGGCAYFFSQWVQIPGLRNQVAELELQVDELTQQNDRFAGLNTQLNSSLVRLSTENDRFVELNGELNESNVRLNETAAVLRTEAAALRNLNSNLTSVVSFLNETAADIDESIDMLVYYLSEQIETNRRLVLETLQNIYLQRVATWDCDFRDFFGDDDFVRNPGQPIGEPVISAVLDYVHERVLTELCLDQTDFEEFLLTTVLPTAAASSTAVSSISVRQLVSGVQRYTALAMDYYFPDTEDAVGGLTTLDWASASYACEYLPASRQFLFSVD